jgi:succinoglycan biosynthesis protein ExoL
MPCRFYEAGYYGVPCLAVHRFEVGNVIEKHRIGWTFDAPLEESLVRFFERLTEKDYEMIRARLAAVPSSMFVAAEDVAQLCEKLACPKPGSLPG